MGYNSYMAYLDGIGLERTARYSYQDKQVNVMRETERMIDRGLMMFQWHNLPGSIPEKQLELMLQMQGYAIIGRIDGKLYACYGGLGGVLDEYCRPTKAIVSIPYLDYNATWDIGKDCAVIRNDTMMQGLLPLYAKYNTLINETEISVLLATVNQRIETIISASDNPTIESAKKYLDDLMAGKQGIIADNAFLQSLSITAKNQNAGNIRELLESLQYLKASLYNEIGLATNYNLKKERVTKAEIELNTDNLYPLVDNMYYCRLDGIKEVEKLFDINLEVELNSSWDYRVYNGEPITTKGDSNDGTGNEDIADVGSDSGDIGLHSNDVSSGQDAIGDNQEEKDKEEDKEENENNE